MQPITSNAQQTADGTAELEVSRGEEEARLLLKRTPTSYLLNQAYGLWVFISLFLITVIVTRKLSVEEYGVYAVAFAAFNTIAYIVALGLEDATTTYIPRVFSEHGRDAAAALIRRLLVLRLAILALSVGIMLLAMPALAVLIAAIPIGGAASVAAGLRDPGLLGHITPIAIYVLGNGISGLITSVCASLMRMRFVFVLGGITQLVLLVLSFVVLQLGFGTDGVLWLFAIVSLFNALAFLFWLYPLLFLRRQKTTYIQPLKPVVQLGISAWLTNLVTGALLKQVSIILLGVFAISIIQIGYFNLSFQLAHAASLLLVSGFGGVSGAALSAAFVGRSYDRLARSWQVLIKIETLLAAPVLIFCLFNAQNVAHALYGANYDPVGPLLAIFLFFQYPGASPRDIHASIHPLCYRQSQNGGTQPVDWAGSSHMHRDTAHSALGTGRRARRRWYRPDHHRRTDAGHSLAHLATKVSFGIHRPLYIRLDTGSPPQHYLASAEPPTPGAFRGDILALVRRTADNY